MCRNLQRVVLYADSVEHAVTAPESSGLATGRGGELAARSLSQVMTAQPPAPAHMRACDASEGSAPEVLDDPGDHQPGTDHNTSQWHGMVADETGGRRGAPVLDDGESSVGRSVVLTMDSRVLRLGDIEASVWCGDRDGQDGVVRAAGVDGATARAGRRRVGGRELPDQRIAGKEPTALRIEPQFVTGLELDV